MKYDQRTSKMSKLSTALKAAINAPFARPNTVPAPKGIRDVYRVIEQGAAQNDVGLMPWLAISTAATMTMNSPESMTVLHGLATAEKSHDDVVQVTEAMREVGLKCISFNGIPRTINVLGAFRASLPESIIASLSKTSTRVPTPSNLPDISSRGQGLWNSIYAPFESKLLGKLEESHPDLPVHILNSHYGPLLADFPGQNPPKIGRILTSIVAVTCLRAQTGVGPQVLSHVFGLRKAIDDGTWKASGEEVVQGAEWLASDDGNMWILGCVDRIVEAIGEGDGTTFAPGFKSKL